MGGLTQPGNSYTLFGYSRKEGLLVGAVSHMQIILSHHKHIHLPARVHAHACTRTHSQCEGNRMMGRKWAVFWEAVKLAMQPVMPADKMTITSSPRKRGVWLPLATTLG